MAAELLDIEAKLDTSQVQSQLNQLSKTSGLQNLDRAIRTLEQSMKRLSAALDKQAQQAIAGGGGSGGGGQSLLGRNGALLGRTGAVRSMGLYWLGKQIGSGADSLESKYGWKAGVLAETAGGALKGAAFGPLAMAFGAVNAATSAVSEHFAKLAEVSEKLIEAKMKEWEATDKAFASIEAEVKDIRMRAVSAGMSPEERRKEIDRLQTARSEAVSNMASNYDIAKDLEGPMYDAAVAAAQYWRDAVKDIDKNLSILQSDNDKYSDALMKSARASAKAAKEEQHLAEQREKIKESFAADLRSSEFQQKLASLQGAAQFTGMSQADIKQQASQASFAYNVSLAELNKLRKEAIASGTPEDYEKRIKEKETEVNEKEQLANAWQSMIAEPMKMSLSEMIGNAALGPTSSLASMGLGLGGELIEDKLLNNTDRMLTLLRIVAENSKKWTQAETSNIATYQS